MSIFDWFRPDAEDTAERDSKAQAAADVKAWLKRIHDARDFDKAARKQYAMDRRYARGDSGQFEVCVPVAPAYIEILKSYLYARNPDLDVLPADATNSPPMADLLEMARKQVQDDPMALQEAQQAGTMAGQQASMAASVPPQEGDAGGEQSPAMPPLPPAMAAQQAQSARLEELAKARAEQMMAPYKQRQHDAKQLASTLEMVVSQAWKKARLKAAADSLVGSGLTVGAGWLKASWQERNGPDPIIQQQIADLQANLEQLSADRYELASGESPDPDALRAKIEQEIAGLQAQVEVTIARGLGIDFVAAENMQVAPEVPTLTGYTDAPWVAERIFMTLDEAKAQFPYVRDKLKNASVYHQVKPIDPSERRMIGLDAISDVTADEADTYRSGTGAGTMEHGNVCVWEVWHRAANTVLTLVEGLDCYAVEPYSPTPGTSRFYPHFLWAPTRCDGERHPQSLITRTAPLLDDMNRIYSNRAEHRRRCIPKLGFDATLYEKSEIEKLEAGGVGEMVGLKPTRPGSPISEAVVPIAYPAMDRALYDDGPTRAALEMAWGIQEALSSTIRTAKTLGEAEIQQSGTQARQSYMRDLLDGIMGEIAEYSAETLLQALDRKDAEHIAGPWAFWPEAMSVDELSTLVNVDIRAGSSGKPDTTAQREAWAAVMPILSESIVQVGQLRGSDPGDVADCIEELVAETLERTGDRLEAARFLPAAPAVPNTKMTTQPMMQEPI